MGGGAWGRQVVARVRSRQAPPVREAPEDRLARAVALVAGLERSSASLPAPTGARARLVGDRFSARPLLPPSFSDMLPAPWRHQWPPEEPAPDLRSEEIDLAADVLVLGKYDSAALGLKLRAAYAEPGLVLGVLPAVVDRSHQGLRIATAHAVVGRHAPEHIPELVDLQELPDGSRVVIERWVDGRPLLRQSRLERATPEILAVLARVHRGYGVSWRRLSDLEGLSARTWAEVVATGLVPAAVARQVGDLLARDGTVRWTWTHGDPVASNVLATDAGVVLVDWEMSGPGPMMKDAAKLHLYARDHAATLAVILEACAVQTLPAGGLTPGEELAVAHARLLARYPSRRAQLEGHPRLAALDAQAGTLGTRIADALAA